MLSSFAVTPGAHQLLNILIGFGIAGTGFGVILAVVGRAASPENRSVALGVATAAGSAGQVFGAPAAELLMQVYPWQTVFVIFAVVILSALLFLPLLSAPERATKQQLEDSLGTVLRRAFRDPSFTLIFAGFFACGYQLGFITAHFPAFVTEVCGAISPTGPLAAQFRNDSLKTASRVAEGTTLETGVLASDLGTDTLAILRDIQAFHEGPQGPLSGKLTEPQKTFLTSQLNLLEQAGKAVTEKTAMTGAQANQVDTLIASHKDQIASLDGLVADRTDADMLKAVTDLQLSQVAIQASAQVISQLRQSTLLNYLS